MDEVELFFQNEKTEKMRIITGNCGCKCHLPFEEKNTLNYFWCSNCKDRHKNDVRYCHKSFQELKEKYEKDR